MATIREIARESGVSVGTVSNVLNNRRCVSDGLRKRVIEVIELHKYRPNAIARSLSTRKTRTLGLIISLNQTPFYTDLAQGAIEAASIANCSLSVVATAYDGHDLPEQLDVLTHQWVDGIFIAIQPVIDTFFERIIVGNTPLVVMDRGGSHPDTAVGAVGFDWFNGAYIATQHLIELGHRKIGFVSGIPGRSSSILRERGYIQALEDHGIPFRPELYGEGDFFYESGYTRALEMLRLKERPTALFMANDLMAMGVYQAAAELHLRIPEDISVVGIDDNFFTKFLSPPLTTVHIPTKEAGAIGINMLLGNRKANESVQHVLLSTPLVVRSSTCQLAIN